MLLLSREARLAITRAGPRAFPDRERQATNSICFFRVAPSEEEIVPQSAGLLNISGNSQPLS
eukprot:733161-Heterocapsa_arctica.AAC.1